MNLKQLVSLYSRLPLNPLPRVWNTATALDDTQTCCDISLRFVKEAQPEMRIETVGTVVVWYLDILSKNQDEWDK